LLRGHLARRRSNTTLPICRIPLGIGMSFDFSGISIRHFSLETSELKLGKSLATRYPFPATTHWQPGLSHIAEN
jgi:hypothetical protein